MIPSTLDVVLLVLAAYRLHAIWMGERIAAPIRNRIRRLSQWTAYLADCSLCISVWTSFAVTLLWAFGGLVGTVVVTGFAVSAGVLFLLLALSRLTREPVAPRWFDHFP